MRVLAYALLSVASVGFLTGCASNTAPTNIGGDTYFSAAQNRAGFLGNPTTIAGRLIVEGNEFCAEQGKKFEIVTQNVTQAQVAQTGGGASITFKCVDSSSDVILTPQS